MKHFAVYDKTTGEVLRSGVCSDPKDQILYLTEGAVEGMADPGEAYVKDGRIKPFPGPRPWDGASWNLDLERWDDPTVEEWEAIEESENIIAWALARAKRDELLDQSDKYMVADFPITPERRQLWADYRAALRDLETIMADPANPAWPEQPSK